MRFLVLMKPDPAAYLKGTMPSEAEMAAMMKFNEELVAAGVLLSGEGLHPPQSGARVTFAGGKATVTDGPFPETKEVIGGFWMWKVKSKEEALEWARKCPAGAGDQLEIRQVFESEEFGPEVATKENALRAEVEKQHGT